jgi:hypothetical protein
MYYEEQWIDGTFSWRTSPDGAWTAYTTNELAWRYQCESKQGAAAYERGRKDALELTRGQPMTPGRWTTDKPIRQGWYWFRNGVRLEVVRIDQPFVPDSIAEAYYQGGEWYGPLEAPP